MGIPPASENLASRATSLRESLRKSQNNTDQMVTILGSFDHRLSALDAVMRPTQVRTHGVRVAHENIEKTLKTADFILVQFDICRQVETKILKGPHEDLEGFLEAVNQLKTCSEFFRANKSYKSSEGMINIVNNMLEKAVVKLEEEFRQILSSYSVPVEPNHLFKCLPESQRLSSGSSVQQGDSSGNTTMSLSKHEETRSGAALFRLPTLIPPRVLPLLHALAQQLNQARRQMQCLKIFRETHGSALEQSFRKLGVEKLSSDDVQKMPWNTLEAKIRNWIQSIRVAVKLLFAEERLICNQIFEGIDALREQCFAEVTSNGMRTLLSFGETVSKAARAPEKLFAFLDMYEIMQELQSEIKTTFEGKTSLEIIGSTSNLVKQLTQAIRENLNFFQESIEKDSVKSVVQDGKVHPATSYVMNYLKYLLEYQSLLKKIFQVSETGGMSNNQLETVTVRIIQSLLSNLDLKSKQYKDPALMYLFLMNNIHYIVTSVRKSEANDLLGDDWVQRHRRIVKQNADLYRRAAFAEILQSLSIQGLASTGGGGGNPQQPSGASREKVKERFRLFNIQFEELHQRQQHWTIPDAELRESLRLMIAEVLLPAYRSFVKRFGPMIENSKYAERFIKYAPEELDRILGDFFEGKPQVDQKR